MTREKAIKDSAVTRGGTEEGACTYDVNKRERERNDVPNDGDWRITRWKKENERKRERATEHSTSVSEEEEEKERERREEKRERERRVRLIDVSRHVTSAMQCVKRERKTIGGFY